MANRRIKLAPTIILVILVPVLISEMVTNLPHPLTGYYYSTRYIGQRLVDSLEQGDRNV